MASNNFGKLRGLQQITNRHGNISILALDHRESFKKLIEKSGTEITFDNVVKEKMRIVEKLSATSSAILLDPLYGAQPAVLKNKLPGDTGLIVALDHSGYSGTATARITNLIPNWNVEMCKKMGAAAIKLMVLYNPDSQAASQQEDLVRQVADESLEHDITFILEPIIHSVEVDSSQTGPTFIADKAKLIMETVNTLSVPGVDLLKIEFPGNSSLDSDSTLIKNCEELNRATVLPWIVLSGGKDFSLCYKEVKIACMKGASGYAIGRTIWQDGVVLPNECDRDKFLDTVASARMEILNVLTKRFSGLDFEPVAK